MKKILLAGILTASAFALQAQSFTVTPSSTVTGTLAGSEYKDFSIHMTNNLQGILHLRYELVSNTFPAGWTVTLCDYQQCFANIPSARTMDPIPQGSEGFIKLTMTANDIIGNGAATFRIYDTGDSAATSQLINFEINSVVAVDEADLGGFFTVSPNPASDRVVLRPVTGSLDAGMVRLYNLTGAEVSRQSISNGSSAEISLATLPTGVYLLKYETEAGVLSHKIFKTN